MTNINIPLWLPWIYNQVLSCLYIPLLTKLSRFALVFSAVSMLSRPVSDHRLSSLISNPCKFSPVFCWYRLEDKFCKIIPSFARAAQTKS